MRKKMNRYLATGAALLLMLATALLSKADKPEVRASTLPSNQVSNCK